MNDICKNCWNEGCKNNSEWFRNKKLPICMDMIEHHEHWDKESIDVKNKCISCEIIYHPKDDNCRRCELEEVKRDLTNQLTKTKVYNFLIKILDWLDNLLTN